MSDQTGTDGWQESWDGLDPEWRRAFEFIEKTVGGRIVRHHRHPRWRPAFDLDLERDGEIVPIHFRGERPRSAFTRSNMSAALSKSSGNKASSFPTFTPTAKTRRAS